MVSLIIYRYRNKSRDIILLNIFFSVFHFTDTTFSNKSENEEQAICEEVENTVCIQTHRNSKSKSKSSPPLCDAETSSASTSNNVTTDSGVKIYTCQDCGAKLTRRSYLNKHMLRHVGIKKFICDDCGARFTRKGVLKRHMFTHTRIKDFECSVCLTRFTRKGHLDRHMLTHTGMKKFECDICHTRFTLKRNLNRHMLTHTR